MDRGKDHGLPPPPPVLEGTRPTRAPGYDNVAATSRALVPKIAERPGYGKTGQFIELIVNHFNARLVKDDDVYQYNVSIEPEVANKKIFRDVMTKVQETFGVAEFRGRPFAFDGEKTLFTYGQLSFNSKEFPVFLDDSNGGGGRRRSADDDGGVSKRKKTNPRGRDYTVKIVRATKVRMKSLNNMMQGSLGSAREGQDALRVLDTVLRESAARQNFLVVKDNFFHSSLGSVLELGEGIVGWRGYHYSVKPTSMGLTLNLDITMTTVLSPISVVEFLKERFNLRDVSDMRGRDWTKAKGILKSVRVQTKHLVIARTHKIAGFSDQPIRELKFTRRIIEGQDNVQEEETSVEKYYYDTYNYKLKYPNLPALDVGNKKKSTFLPIELCTIVEGQRYMGSLSSKQRQLQIAACKQGPEERQRLCEKAINANKYSSDKLLAEFGLKFDNSLARVEGRVLPAPQLEFGDRRVERPQDGRWNFSNKKLNEGADIGLWAVVVFDPRCNDGGYIGDQLRASCCKRGMRMGSPLCVVKEPQSAIHNSPVERVSKLFDQLEDRVSPRKPEFVLAILPEKDSSLYVPLKRHCEIHVGVISQCMVKPRYMNDQYFGNLALKINLKFGGYNSLLARGMTTCLGTSTIIFGMDVSHGSPGDVNVPSIAAVVATQNWPSEFHYSTQVRCQPSKTEMIQDLQDMVVECLRAYYKSCPKKWDVERCKPNQIIVYRDGLGESQFSECLEVEFTAFKEACKWLDKNYNPGITFIVCQKRHNTRFFPRGQRLKNGNVLPGTVVDKHVCHPYGYDFFLVSQAGLIGTSRPTHYHVLVNENKLGPDDIQQLTYNLCHTFGRCTTSISMAAPAAYAHVLALRYMKTFVNTSGRGYDTASLRNSRDGQVADPRPTQELPELKSIFTDRRHSMFFV